MLFSCKQLMSETDYNEFYLDQNFYLLQHRHIVIQGLHPEALNDAVNGRTIREWFEENKHIQSIEATNTSKTNGKYFVITDKNNFDAAQAFLITNYLGSLKKSPKHHKMSGYEYPCRPDRPRPPSRH
jgi:hypothetical protein